MADTPGRPALTRRQAVAGVATSAIGWMADRRTALAQAAISGAPHGPRDVLVVVFLRGGADCLNLVVPHGDADYYRARPTIAVPAPGDRRATASRRALDLDGFHGLNPALAPLLPLYRAGRLAVVHACGSGDQTRSHFEAMAAMERGLAREESGAASGWIARHLATTDALSGSPLRAVALSTVAPDSLRGATDFTVLSSLKEFRLTVPGPSGHRARPAVRACLSDLYGVGGDVIADAGRETLEVLAKIERIDPGRYVPAGGAAYPASEFGEGMKQAACLIKSGVGLEVACLDHRGPLLWDTHVTQDSILPAQASDLAQGLAAFAADLGAGMDRVTLVAMTEFGRRVAENSGLGTDHGRAGAMFVIGGGVAGGRVHGRWPGLSDDRLEKPGDLRVTTDYRDVLAEVVERRLGNRRVWEVFVDHRPTPTGIIAVPA